MSEKIQPNPEEVQTQDAQLLAENIASGEEKAPKVDFDSDYEAAQQYSVSEVDRTDEGAALAEEVTTPQYEMSTTAQTNTEAEPTGNPDDYREMAKDVGGYNKQAVSEVSDDLLQKALDLGKPQA